MLQMQPVKVVNADSTTKQMHPAATKLVSACIVCMCVHL